MTKHGDYYWEVVVRDEVLMIKADRFNVSDSGALVVYSPHRRMMAFAPGEWRSIKAADIVTGHPVNVDSVHPLRPKQ